MPLYTRVLLGFFLGDNGLRSTRDRPGQSWVHSTRGVILGLEGPWREGGEKGAGGGGGGGLTTPAPPETGEKNILTVLFSVLFFPFVAKISMCSARRLSRCVR